MPVNALKVENREFTTFEAVLQGGPIQISGEYTVTVVNNGLLPVPVTLSLNEVKFDGVTIIEEESVSLGRVRGEAKGSVEFEATVVSPSSLINNACQSQTVPVKVNERLTGVLLALATEEEVDVESPSPSCDISVDPPGGGREPSTPPEDPSEEPPDDGGDGGGDDGGSGGGDNGGGFGSISQPAQIEVSSVDVPGSVTAGDQITANVSIENTGEESGSETITFSVNGQQTDSEDVNLDAGETTNLNFNYGTSQNDSPAVNIFVASPFNSQENTVDVEINAVDMEIDGPTDPLEDLDNTYDVEDDPDETSEFVWNIYNTDAETGGAPRDETRTTTDDEITVTFNNPGEFEIEVEALNNGGAVIGEGSIEGIVLDQFGGGDDPIDDTPRSGTRSMSEAVEDLRDDIDEGF